jgi:hypothetical protein
MLRRTLAAMAAAMLVSQASQAQTAAPAGQGGGLDFQNPVVAENISGLAASHAQQASLLPGRVALEGSPDRIRSGQTSIRMQVQPGDCGPRVNGGGQDDCAEGNERVDIDSDFVPGTQLYAFSMMLGSDFGSLSRNGTGVSLVQWYQRDLGACYAIQYSISERQMFLRNRCPQGVYDPENPEDVALRGRTFDQWNEFVVLAVWSKGQDGLFRVLQNNTLVYDHRGPTLAPTGGDDVSQRFSILRYNGLGVHQAPSTVWLDDIVRSNGVAAIEQRYAFDRANLGVQ